MEGNKVNVYFSVIQTQHIIFDKKNLTYKDIPKDVESCWLLWRD